MLWRTSAGEAVGEDRAGLADREEQIVKNSVALRSSSRMRPLTRRTAKPTSRRTRSA